MSSPLQDIERYADELTDPRQHTERTHTWVNRNKKIREHRVTMPGLLTQLHEAIYPGASEGVGRTHPASRPPLAMEAMSRYAEIVTRVSWWCWELRIDMRDSVESNVRALVGRAPVLPADQVKLLRADLKRWRTWCAVATGWERIEKWPTVPCMRCEMIGSLRVNLTTGAGYCINPTRVPAPNPDDPDVLECGATWDEEDGSIIVLGRYIKTMTQHGTTNKEAAA